MVTDHLCISLALVALVATVVPPRSRGVFQGQEVNKTFFDAVTKGDVVVVNEMVKSDPKLATAKDNKGVSAILKACYFRKQDVIMALLATGIELNIFEAAATGQTRRLRDLIKSDRSLINSYNVDGFFPLGLAAFFGHADSVQALLDAGADVNQRSTESMKVSSLQASTAANRLDIARMLIAHGADVNARTAGGFRPLHEAALKGDVEFAKVLLDSGAELNAKTDDGKTALAMALERNNKQMAEFLQAKGAVK